MDGVLVMLLTGVLATGAAVTPRRGSDRPLVVAHRGGAALAPENTLAAFANAIRLGADQVECDVHLTRDGEVVVLHDPDVARTTDGTGRIDSLTLAAARRLDAAARFPGGHAAERIPMLAELLDLAKGRIGVQIEIKLDADGRRHPGIERKVVESIDAFRMREQVVVISFDLPTLRAVKALDPRVRTGALVGADRLAGPEAADVVHEVLADSGADWFLPAAGPVTAATVDAVHAAGRRIGVWTVDASAEMRRCADLGVDAITTNRPDTLLRVLGR